MKAGFKITQKPNLMTSLLTVWCSLTKEFVLKQSFLRRRQRRISLLVQASGGLDILCRVDVSHIPSHAT